MTLIVSRSSALHPVECLTIWVCLLLFLPLDSSYGFWERIWQKWSVLFITLCQGGQQIHITSLVILYYLPKVVLAKSFPCRVTIFPFPYSYLWKCVTESSPSSRGVCVGRGWRWYSNPTYRQKSERHISMAIILSPSLCLSPQSLSCELLKWSRTWNAPQISWDWISTSWLLPWADCLVPSEHPFPHLRNEYQ